MFKAYPDAKIDFLLKSGIEGLFDDHPFIDQVLIWNKRNRKYKNFFQLLSRIRKQKYDLVINIQRFASTGFLTWRSKAGLKIGFDKNPFSFSYDHKIKHVISGKDNPVHEVDRNLELIKVLDFTVNRRPKMYPSKKDWDFVNQYKTSEYICIAPASLWFTKQFPVNKWVEFISGVPKKMEIFLMGSRADNDICDEIIKFADRPLIKNLAGELTLLQTAALMKDSRMNYVNDSAPQHLASAVNAPVTTIFCSTIPSFGFGPLSEDSYVVEISEILKCRPCGLHGLKSCPEKHFRCAMEIKKEQLLDKI